MRTEGINSDLKRERKKLYSIGLREKERKRGVVDWATVPCGTFVEGLPVEEITALIGEKVL